MHEPSTLPFVNEVPPSYDASVFLPYLQGNATLPSEMSPLLDEYLSKLTSSLLALDEEITQMEAALSIKKQVRLSQELERTKYSRLQSPVRRVPPEIWAIVFGLVLGFEPFGQMQREAYVYLRSVCALWRQVVASNPSLCTGMHILLDTWVSPEEGAVQLQLQRKIAPWLALISRSHSYHLQVVERMKSDFALPQEHRKVLAQYLLSTTPRPATLTILSPKFMMAILALPSMYSTITKLELYAEPDFDGTRLQDVFPNLASLVVKGPLILDEHPFSHPNVQSLKLLDFDPRSEGIFVHFLTGLPRLRELEICASDVYEPEDDDVPPSPITLPSIEILAIGGEYLVDVLDHLTLPNLKLFGLETWGMVAATGFFESTLPAFFQRSRSARITVSMKGPIMRPFFAMLLVSLPFNTRFYCNVRIKETAEQGGATSFRSNAVEEILCSNLGWVDGWRDLTPCTKSTKVFFVAESAAKKEEAESKRHQLSEAGYALEIVSRDAMRALLGSSISRISIEWYWSGII